VRILRLAMGVTVTVGLALGIGWKLSFITPVLVASFLSAPAPGPSARAGLGIILSIAGAFALGVVVTLALVPYPPVCLLAIALLLFLIFYWNLGGAPPFLVTMLLIAVTVIPLMGTQSGALVVEFAKGFLLSGSIAVGLVYVAHALLPDPTTLASQAPPPAPAPSMPPDERLRLAVISTAVVFPLAVLFLTFQLTGALLVLVFVALLAQQPSLVTGLKGGLFLIAGSLLGGITAVVFYNLLIAVPSFFFLLLLTLLVCLLYGEQIFSDNRVGALFASGITTVFVLIGSGTGPIGDEADAKFYTRIFLIIVATVYMVGAMSLLEHLTHRRERARRGSRDGARDASAGAGAPVD
jgi:hypothetical protein